MDTSVNSINPISTSANMDVGEQYKEKIKELAKSNSFDKFDLDNDGKISGIELTKLKQVFNSIDFDIDEDNAVDESAFNDALSDYKE